MALKKMFLLLTPLLFMLTGCLELASTYTLKNGLISSVEAIVEVDSAVLPLMLAESADFEPRHATFRWEDDGTIEEIAHHEFHLATVLRLPSAALVNATTYQQAVNRMMAFIEQEESLDADYFKGAFPTVAGKILTFDLSDLRAEYDKEVAKQRADLKPEEMTTYETVLQKVFSSINYQLRFVSEDDTTVNDVYYMDERGRRISIEFVFEEGNTSIYRLPLRVLVNGTVNQLFVELV